MGKPNTSLTSTGFILAMIVVFQTFWNPPTGPLTALVTLVASLIAFGFFVAAGIVGESDQAPKKRRNPKVRLVCFIVIGILGLGALIWSKSSSSTQQKELAPSPQAHETGIASGLAGPGWRGDSMEDAEEPQDREEIAKSFEPPTRSQDTLLPDATPSNEAGKRSGISSMPNQDQPQNVTSDSDTTIVPKADTASPVTPAPSSKPDRQTKRDEETTAVEAALRTWSDSTGEFRIEARMVDLQDGKVTLKRPDGKEVAVPLERLGESDRAYVAKHAGGAASAAGSTEPKPLAAETKLAGGYPDEGWDFRHEDTRPLLGIRYGLGGWDGEKTVGRLEPVFDRRPVAGTAIVARPDYAVGGLNVDAKRFVNAMQVVFMRLKPDGRLDPADSYTSDWIGFRSGRPTVSLAGEGAAIVGIYGRHGAILNAVGLIRKTK